MVVAVTRISVAVVVVVVVMIVVTVVVGYSNSSANGRQLIKRMVIMEEYDA